MAEWIFAMLMSVPVPTRDRVEPASELRSTQLREFALEIAAASKSAPRPPLEWAMLMVMVGERETYFESRLVMGDCFWDKRECDAAVVKGERIFRARGAFQNQRNTLNAEWWEAANGNVAAQVNMASDALRRGFNTCRNAEPAFPQNALRGYAGSSCSKPMKGESERMVTYARLQRIPRPRSQKPAG